MKEHRGEVVSVCTSERTGTQKDAVERVNLLPDYGIEGDAHAGVPIRQVSLLAQERIDQMRSKGLELTDGAFGENIITRGVDLDELEVGRRLYLGQSIVQVSQHGKECHDRCAIYYAVGDCIMPRHGMFVVVRRGGEVRPGDEFRTAPELDALRYAVVTVSDRASSGVYEDKSGPAIDELMADRFKAYRVAYEVIPDERELIAKTLVRLCDEELVDVVLTTGGTGVAPRDVTPDATLDVIDREVQGIAEAIRMEGLKHTPMAMLSRAVVGHRRYTLIVNLSGSPKAVREQLDVISPVLPHAVEVLSGVTVNCGKGQERSIDNRM